MGGYGSGGYNKTHESEQQRRSSRIDSFKISNWLNYAKYPTPCVNLRDVRYYPQANRAEILQGGTRWEQLMVSIVTGIDGVTRMIYFYCPSCGRRCRFLYRNDDKYYKCRTCAGLNYESSQVGGMKRLEWKMQNIAERMGCYDCRGAGDDFFVAPGMPNKPPRMRKRTYKKLSDRYIRLAREYDDKFISQLSPEIRRAFNGIL